jgi:uncharacterized protein (DUF2147 family)
MRSSILPTLLLTVCLPVMADSIEGLWVLPGGDAVIEIAVDKDGTASLSLLRTLTPGQDRENPDRSLQDRFLAGIELERGFRRKDDTWKGGQIYDPGSGNTYKARITRIDNDHLELRGYVGAPFLGRSETWRLLALFKSQMTRMLDMECKQ